MPTLEVSKMNPAQMMILESFADVKDENEVSDLMTVLRNFYASRLEREMERLSNEGTLDAPAWSLLRGQHLRTPYRRLAT